MIEILLFPFEFEFMRKAFIISLVISVPASLFSCFLILKGWALMGDAISHAVLPGIALAYIFGVPLFFGAFCAGIFCALSSGFLSQNSRLKEDTVMGIVFSGLFGLGLILSTAVKTEMHLDHILFGNILGISVLDIFITGSIGILVTVILILKQSDFLLHSFDPVQAQIAGLNKRVLNYGLLVMLALTIVSTLSSVGIILSIGLLITPGAIAFLITKQFKIMMLIALFVTLISSFFGVYLSFFIDSAPAPTIILILSVIFIFVFLFAQIKDLVITKTL